MVGYRGQEGLMIRAVRAVFQQAADLASSRIYTIKMSYLEVPCNRAPSPIDYL